MCNSIHEFIKPINKFKEQNMKGTDNGQKTEIDLFFSRGKNKNSKSCGDFIKSKLNIYTVVLMFSNLVLFYFFVLRRNRVKMENDMCSSAIAVCFAWQLEIKK